MLLRALAAAVLAAIMLPGAAMAEDLPHRSAPAGFRLVEGPHGGRILLGSIAGPFDSAPAALGATFRRLRRYFDGPLPVGSAVAEGRGIVAFFNGRLGRTAVAGLAAIGPNAARGADVAVLFDLPQRAARTLPALAKTLRAGAGTALAAGPANVALTRQSLPDGSGSIGVPSGWRMIGGGKGMVDLVADDGAQAHIGIMFPVWDPRAGFADPRKMQLPFVADPTQAALAVGARAQRIAGAEPPPAEVLSSRPVAPPMGAGRAALIHVRAGGSQPRELVVLANSAWLGGSAWMFYATTLEAPPARFAADYPVMLALWRSYEPNQQYLREVRADTARTLQQASDLIDGATQRSITASEQQNAGVDNIINGQEVLETTADGAHWHGDAGAAQSLAAKYPDKYRIVPTDQYRSGDY